MHTLQIATFITATAAAVGSLVRIANHEHDPSLMINKATARPWCGELFAGTRLPDDVPDLSE